MGSSNENSGFHPVKNPRDHSRVPGGSSGGSAAVVAAGTAVASLGSDTGGSIRQPGAFCGVVGLKPTYGRVSRYGLIAFASSLDHVGPFGKTVKDVALILQHMAGRDPMDSTSADLPVPNYVEQVGEPVKGMKIGVPKEYFGDGLDPEVRAAVEGGIQELAKAGCEIVSISLPHTEYAIPTYYLIATAEASSNLARFDGVRYGVRAKEAKTLAEMYRKTRDAGFGTEVKRRIMLGTYALSAGYYDAYYLKAQRVRSLLARDFDEAFAQGRCHRDADDSDAGIQAGRKGRRSAGHVSGGHLHRDGEPGWGSRNYGAVRQEQRRTADRTAGTGQAFRRGDGVEDGARGGTRAGDESDLTRGCRLDDSNWAIQDAAFR